MRVLVADDDAVGRRMMATAIELLGHDVTQVPHGEAAIDSFLEYPCEILVLDWMMPRLDGIEVARHIRDLESANSVATEDLLAQVVPRPNEPVILLATAFDDAHLVAAALEAGVDDYMIKPVSMAEIRARIAIAVERFHLRQRTEERERALRRARARAEALSQARAAFLANMSHELRTPLNGIVGLSDFFLSGALDEEYTEAAEIIRACALSLEVIIDDILDLTQIDEGRMPIVPRPFDVRVLMEQIVGLYSARAAKSRLKLDVDVAETVPDVLVGDQTRIRQILSNLINNAIKYTEGGVVSLCVQTEAAPTDGAMYRFSVTDTGPGISRDAQATLFERFNRGSATEEPGHGLGLTICRGLVELMNGRIGVESTVGEGACFWFVLPLVQGDGSAPSETKGLVRQPTRPIAVLVVEDDRFNQTVARRLLERAGCRVTIAENGQEGLDRIEEARPDIIFMDVQMPVMDGLEAARTIRRNEQEGQRVPIVGLTASSVAGARARCIEAGMDGYLQKPVQLSAIIHALVEHLPEHYD